MFSDTNDTNQGSKDDQMARLLLETDWVRCGMAGGLASFRMVDRTGKTILCSELDYNGQKTGYTADPQEIINYIEAHDNETLFDALQWKLPIRTEMKERVRVQNLGMSLLAFSQGVPFSHAGVELLRSKSGDRNSYNSGDWFNKLDFTYQANNWGVGLPPKPDNGANWTLLAPLLRDLPKASSKEILGSFTHMLEVLAIRRSTPLLRLRTAADINAKVQLLNGGPDSVLGLIAMVVQDKDGSVDRQPATEDIHGIHAGRAEAQDPSDSSALARSGREDVEVRPGIGKVHHPGADRRGLLVLALGARGRAGGRPLAAAAHPRHHACHPDP